MSPLLYVSRSLLLSLKTATVSLELSICELYLPPFGSEKRLKRPEVAFTSMASQDKPTSFSKPHSATNEIVMFPSSLAALIQKDCS